MRKRLIQEHQAEATPSERGWLHVEELAEVELTSEDAAHPIEAAFLATEASGWRAAEPGKQTIRLVFENPQSIRLIQLNFVEPRIARTQEYVLRWSPDKGQSFREIVRQQWNFSPPDASTETENHHVELAGVSILELCIIPDISGSQNAFASLDQWRIA